MADYITYEYDALNRLTTVKSQGTTTLATYTYDARSRRTGLNYANGAGMEYEYSTANRLLSLDNFTDSGEYIYEYTSDQVEGRLYDKVGNRTSMAVTTPGGTEMHVYEYDDIYQITDVNYPTGYDLADDTEYTYDDAGNRTTVIETGGPTVSYVTNALNQYTSVGGITYDYDDSGNLTQDEHFQYAYDPENRLLSATKLAGTPDPLTAACDTTLVFTAGGTANWFSQTTTYHDGGDAAQSGDVADSQESWMETTVEGEGTLSFWWKAYSEVGDYLILYIDDVYIDSICGNSGWQSRSPTIVGLGTHTIRWVYRKDESGSAGSDCGWVDNVQWDPSDNPPVGSLAAALDTDLDVITGGNQDWSSTSYPAYYDDDSARSGYLSQGQISDMQATVSGEGTLIFYWKTSSLSGDCLEFFVDGTRHGDPISGELSWTQVSLEIEGEGNHTLLWRYTKNNYNSSGDNRGYVDYLQWSGDPPIEAPPEWETVSYTYDPSGRRIEKKVDGDVEAKYVYDGDHCIAEYSGAGSLLRKYVYGPCIDEPICMTEASGDYTGTYYYHYDALGSVIALSDSNADVVQLYEYSVYGQVAASDANHPNRFMFTGREFDKDTGLYYYRARYYNPEIGRFLQTDPIGYGDGMNVYTYCENSPIICVDPSGQFTEEIGRAKKAWDEVSAFFDYPYVVKTVMSGGTASTYTYHPTSRWDMYYDIFWADMEAGDEIIALQLIGHGNDKENGWLTIGPDEAPQAPITGPQLNEALGTGDPSILFAQEHKATMEAIGINPKDFTFAELVTATFAPDAVISLDFCYSAKGGRGSVGHAFKALLPDATVFGWTGKICAFPDDTTGETWWVGPYPLPPWLFFSKYVEITEEGYKDIGT